MKIIFFLQKNRKIIYWQMIETWYIFQIHNYCLSYVSGVEIKKDICLRISMQLYTSMCLLSAVLEFYLISIKKKKKQNCYHIQVLSSWGWNVHEYWIYAFHIDLLLLILKILRLVITYFLGNINYLISSKLLK